MYSFLSIARIAKCQSMNLILYSDALTVKELLLNDNSLHEIMENRPGPEIERYLMEILMRVQLLHHMYCEFPAGH